MNCDDVFENILKSQPLSSDMESHIEGCPECKALMTAVEKLDSAGNDERLRDLSSDSIGRVLAEAAEITESRVSPPHMKSREWWFVQRLAAAAAIILAVGTAIMLAANMLNSGDHSDDPSEVADVIPVLGVEKLRSDTAVALSGFMGRYYAASDCDGLDRDFSSLRSHIAMVSSGLEKELVGF